MVDKFYTPSTSNKNNEKKKINFNKFKKEEQSIPSKDDNELFIDFAIRGDLEQLKQLLEKGVDVNAINECGGTALIYACMYGNTESVSFLLQNDKINVNAKNNNGLTALMSASLEGEDDCVSLLLKRPDIDVNIKDKYGRGVMEFALEALKCEGAYKVNSNTIFVINGPVNLKGPNRCISLLIDAGAEVPLNSLHKITLKDFCKYAIKKLKVLYK